jgi:hypothetical protein
MSHLLTLGYTPNPLVETYQDAFLEKLQRLWIAQIGGNMPSRDFLLYPDIHGLLLASVRPGHKDLQNLLAELQLQYTQYIQRGSQHNIDPTEMISGTQIALTMQFSNPDVEKNAHPDHKGISI